MDNEPKNLPDSVDIPAAWVGVEMARTPNIWRWELSPAEIEELRTAGERVLNQYGNVHLLSTGRFELPILGPKLRTMQRRIVNGLGFEVVSGLPVKELGEELSSAIFVGIGAHLGNARNQNAKGDLLGHVRDMGLNSRDPNARIYQTNERQTFHTDSADVVGLLCLNEAVRGGDSLLVSAATIYNRMRREYPDLIQYLFDPIATDRRGEVPEGAKPYFNIPVFSWFRGFLTVMYQRQYIDSAQRFPDAFRLTDQHIKALDQFDKFANDPELHFEMRLRPGDIQFVYNHSLLHDRTAFVDADEFAKKRHLRKQR